MTVRAYTLYFIKCLCHYNQLCLVMLVMADACDVGSSRLKQLDMLLKCKPAAGQTEESEEESWICG